MAFTQYDGKDVYARNAGADLSGKVNYLAKVDTDGDVILATAGSNVLGVIVEDAVQDRPVSVQMYGIGKVVLAEAVTNAGVALASDGNGAGVLADSAGDYAFGIALETGQIGDVVSFYFTHHIFATT
jgi:hypothetical protein